MKKAFDALQAKGLNYDFHDYKKQGIDADTLKIWLKRNWKRYRSQQKRNDLAQAFRRRTKSCSKQ